MSSTADGTVEAEQRVLLARTAAHHENDRFLQSATRQDTIVMPILEPIAGMDADAKRIVFDIVLMRG